VTRAKKLKWQTLKSELQALLIEAELIKAHQPYYNSLLKDDKSQLYLLFTKEAFPRVLRVRKTDLNKKKYQHKLAVLGPFASSYKLTEVLKIIRPIFPWCNKRLKKDGRACLYHHLDLCPGACCGKIEAASYQAQIKQLIAFMRGKNSALIKELTAEMKHLAKEEQFEAAQKIKEKIALIKEITQDRYQLKPDLILPSLSANQGQESLIQLRRILSEEGIVDSKYELDRIEAYDVSNTQGQQPTVSMVTFINGQADQSEYKFFKIRQLDTPNDFAMLQEALVRRQKHPEWGIPKLIVIDGGKGQLRSVQQIWQQDPAFACPVVSLVKHPDRLVIIKAKHEASGWTTKIINLPNNHPALKLLIQLRDESHRFAKKQHTRLRLKNLLQ